MKASAVTQRPTYAELRQQLAKSLEREKAALKDLQDRDQQLAESAKELQDCRRQLAEALEQQTASGEVLRVIASSPTDLRPVLDTLITNAVKLSGATKGHVWQIDGDLVKVVAHYGETFEEVALLQGRPLRLQGRSPSSRAISERQPVQLSDAQIELLPDSPILRAGMRTMVSLPLLREGTAIGTITIWRDVVEPFTDHQIAVLQPLQTKPSSPLKTSGSSKNCRNATRNCARRWNIRLQLPRCSA